MDTIRATSLVGKKTRDDDHALLPRHVRIIPICFPESRMSLTCAAERALNSTESRPRVKFCGTSRIGLSLSHAASRSLRRYRSAVVCKRHAETHDKHPSRRTMMHPTETRGSRPTADGTLTEKTSKRRRDGRAACKASRGGGGGGGRNAEEEKGVCAPPPPPPLPLPPPPPPSFGGFYGRKGCLFLYLRESILE